MKHVGYAGFGGCQIIACATIREPCWSDHLSQNRGDTITYCVYHGSRLKIVISKVEQSVNVNYPSNTIVVSFYPS